MRSGRNHAVLLSGRGEDGVLVRCVAKLPGLMESRALHPLPSLLEWLATAFAAELGVYTPAAFEVEITPEFARSVDDPVVRAGIERSIGTAFGSQFVRGVPMISSEMLDVTLRDAAATLLAFDVFIHNVDRRVENPNILLERDRLIAIDHGDAFAFLWPRIGATVDPVVDPLLDVVGRHAVSPFLSHRTVRGALAAFRVRLAALDDARFEEIRAATTASWNIGPASGRLAQLLDVLRRRRDAVDRWLPQLEAWILK